MKSNIVWKTLKSLATRRFAALGEPEPPDHKAQWVLRGGVPDLCCDLHRLHPRQAPRVGGSDACPFV
jgi:hypothetical protein